MVTPWGRVEACMIFFAVVNVVHYHLAHHGIAAVECPEQPRHAVSEADGYQVVRAER